MTGQPRTPKEEGGKVMTDSLRLTPEVREEAKDILADPAYIPETIRRVCRDALHDLDVLEGELDRIRVENEDLKAKLSFLSQYT